LLGLDFPMIDTGIDTAPEAALCVIVGVYALATIFNLSIPDTGARYKKQEHNPFKLVSDFSECCKVLWQDKLGQISLGVTTLFWGAGATLQFIVLKWAERAFHMQLDRGSVMQGVVAVGVALGAVGAAHFIRLKKSLSVMSLGVAMGLIVMTMTLVHDLWIAYPLLIAVGMLSGFFLVPMNALLQHRGHVLMSAGHSIAVQNFNENLSILTMLALYSILVKLNVDLYIIIVLFGLFVSGSMYLLILRHRANQKKFDSLALIGEEKH
ncbi:MAG: lysophospholipid transporter LplT, partial [Burkholderiales bacterium]|nr:lysophospholipid transporter LplT [Burkholderiales bacterium]